MSMLKPSFELDPNSWYEKNKRGLCAFRNCQNAAVEHRNCGMVCTEHGKMLDAWGRKMAEESDSLFL